jgi:hypothetical protein
MDNIGGASSPMMTYHEFETRFLPVLVDAADSTERGRCEAFSLARTFWPQVKEQWVRDAVRSYEQRGYLGPHITRSISPVELIVTISGEGRKAAESLKALMVAAQQPKLKIGF